MPVYDQGLITMEQKEMRVLAIQIRREWGNNDIPRLNGS